MHGINAENNAAVISTFRDSLAPFSAIGATDVAIQKTNGTDQAFLQSVGLQSFQFIQDPPHYDSRVTIRASTRAIA